ncbi:MAG: prolyl oligopeptidase family serine peptidase [Isosphaeraceae bacterium]
MNRLRLATFLLLLLAPTASSVRAQSAYKTPPPEVVRILDAPGPPLTILSPRHDAVCLVEVQPYPPIRALAEPVLRLAGVRILRRTGTAQSTVRYSGLSILPLDGTPARRVELPEGSAIRPPVWSHDGKRLAFGREVADGLELWVADAATGRARVVPGVRLNDVLADPLTWLSDGLRLLAVVVPEGRAAAPPDPDAPLGPNVQETSGRRGEMATFQDMLSSPRDEALFEHFARAQVARVDLDSGQVERLGLPALFTSVEPSPDERFLLVSSVRRPFSYRVPYNYFPRKTAVLDASGREVAVVADLPVSDNIPRQGVPTGPRSVSWQPLHQARLYWAEALDGGDPRKKTPHRDRLMALEAPFSGQAVEVRKVRHRFVGVSWLPEKDRGLLTEIDRDRRWRTTALVDLARADDAWKVLFDLSINDAYHNPGQPQRVTRPDGTRTLILDGRSIYLAGEGASPEGSRPFLDRFDLETGKSERMFRCAEKSYEVPLGFVGEGREKVLIRHESPSDPPNLFLVDLKSGTRTRLTDAKDPSPQLTGLKKELIKYKRDDGVPLSGTLYLPPGYKDGTKLPLIVWAYPLEYSDADTAGQVRTSPYRFTRFAGPSHLFFVTQGFAVLDDATMPVVGDPETMNDTFVEQISASARAAIETLDRKGVIDPKRVGVGGHSYGAFMTANLLAHTDLFAAGIARSGAYNRSLTPFGFQSERRSYWEATPLYTRVSPFTYANRINEPILLIHGEADNNSGTFPIQSERLFQAIQGNGGTARLVMLPFESHGYRARESVLHVLAEMFEWADRYVKNRKPAS